MCKINMARITRIKISVGDKMTDTKITPLSEKSYFATDIEADDDLDEESYEVVSNEDLKQTLKNVLVDFEASSCNCRDCLKSTLKKHFGEDLIK